MEGDGTGFFVWEWGNCLKLIEIQRNKMGI